MYSFDGLNALTLTCPCVNKREVSENGGGKRIRTADLLLARQALSQLSYTPMVGLSRFELLTSRLSGVRSDQLSYRPILFLNKYKPHFLSGFILFVYYFIKYVLSEIGCQM